MGWLQRLLTPVAYVSLPLFTLKYVAKALPFTRYYVRLFLYLAALGICSAEGLLIAVWLAIVGQRFNTKYYIARSFYLLCGNLLDIEIIMEGEEHLSVHPAVMVGNHQSMIDILPLGRLFPKRASIMAKKQIQYTPLLGQWMSLAGTIFVDRANDRRKATDSLTRVGEVMKEQHTSLWMFPEGTRSMREHDDMLPFKKGAFHLAVQAGLPVIPVVIENYWRLYRKGVFESGTLRIRVLPPIPTTGLTVDDVGALAERTREIMIQALHEISNGPPARTNESQKQQIKERVKEIQLPAPILDAQPSTQRLAAPQLPAAAPVTLVDGADSDSARQRTISTASVTSSRDAGAETEDEGWTKVPGSGA